MGALCLTRRRVQLDLLAELCKARQRARVAADIRQTSDTSIPTRFLQLRDSTVLLDWPANGVPEPLRDNADVHVYFEAHGERLAFCTTTAGRTASRTRAGRTLSAWALALPLRIERRQQRDHYRVSLADLGRVKATFSDVEDAEHKFKVILKDVSAGGLGCAVDAEVGVHLQRDGLYWARFSLSGHDRPFEFVVRLMHIRRADPTDTMVLGCKFQPGEDPTKYREQLRRIEVFVAERQRARLGRASLRAGGK